MLVSCPSCKSKTTWEENPWKPFCSERCKTVDLGKWAMEDYRIAGTAADESGNTRKQDES
jgi:endogenous inhibitor of DNA gyrase (YacG/DUF329 family)